MAYETGPSTPSSRRAFLRMARGAAAMAGAASGPDFQVQLKGGTHTTLQGWFQDAAGADLYGAYYAYVRRV